MKKNINWTVLSFIVLFGLPLLIAKFAGSNGMIFCLIMFFAINPVFFIAEGITAGTNIKKHWFLPVDSALIYLLSMWIVFDAFEKAFIIYAAVYLAIGVVLMLITSAICHTAAKKALPKEMVINCVIFSVFLVVFITVVLSFGVWKYNRTFTSHKWMENVENRHSIVNNMLSKYEIVGMTEKEIVDLLGEETKNAPERFKHPRGEFADEDNLTYGLGVSFMDYEWLIITMENGVAISYTIGAN